MARQSSLSFANVICRFGDAFVLLDFAEEIVLPAFFDPNLYRKFGETKYLFIDQEWASVSFNDSEEADLCIFGRLVKDTILHSDQILADGQLLPNKESIPSAPSAFFVFVLSTHKLIYLPEKSGAPSLEVFGSTLQNFLRTKHRDYINAEYLRRKQTPEAITKMALYDEIPAPNVEVLPLASRESIELFVQSINVLTHLEFRILDTNNEYQMLGPYERIRRDRAALLAKQSKLSYDSPEGLSKAEAAHQIEIAAASGNQRVVVAGIDEDGSVKRGNNDQFSLHVPVGELPDVSRDRAFRLLDLFQTQLSSGNIAIDAGEDTREKIRRIAQRIGRIGDGTNN